MQIEDISECDPAGSSILVVIIKHEYPPHRGVTGTPRRPSTTGLCYQAGEIMFCNCASRANIKHTLVYRGL